MSRLTRYIIILALSISCAGFCPPIYSTANAQDKTIKKPTGSVSGHVTVKGKGKAGIVVGVLGDFGTRAAPIPKATTDQDGNYRINEVAAGTYQIAAISPAYVGAEINSFGQRGKVLILSEGENAEGIDFSLVRGGVITGKVSMADGRPVVEERITIAPADQTERRGPMPQIGPLLQTDDRGIYRIYGLAPGRYKVSIGQSQDSYFSSTRPGRPAYERVFYPDVTNPDEARIVELSEGTEATNIDITVGQSITGFAAAGVVMNGETNQPLAGLRFEIRRIISERNASFVGIGAFSNRLGEFRFEGLTPGKYSAFIMLPADSELRGDPLNFEIVDQDVTGLVFRTSLGGSVSGIIVVEGNHDKAVQSKLAQMRVQAYVRSETPVGGYAKVSSISPDGSFRIGGLQAGVAQFQLTAQDRRLVSGYVISRVERDGVVSPRGLEIGSGEKISGLKIFVVYGSGIVRGTIKIENGVLPPDARLMVRLVKQEQSIPMASNVDARGRFAIEGIPAGTYELWVNCYVPNSSTRPPSSKQSVIVTEGAATELEVVLDLDPNVSPKP
jgi:protocatechuate 3,4-dioxygenase beta subunit